MNTKKITSKKIRTRFNNIKSLSKIWRHCVLKFIGRIVRQNTVTLPQKFLYESVNNKLTIGRKFEKCKDATVKSIRILILSTLESGHFKYWFGHTTNARKWNGMISTLHSKIHPCYSTNSCLNTHRRNSNCTVTENSSKPSHFLPLHLILMKIQEHFLYHCLLQLILITIQEHFPRWFRRIS